MRAFIIYLLLFLPIFSWSQKQIPIQYTVQSKVKLDFEPKVIVDTFSIQKLEQSLLQQCYILGFATASATLNMETDILKATITTGNQFLWNSIRINEEQTSFNPNSNKYAKALSHNAITEKSLAEFFKLVITDYENNGFPFAAIELDSIEINNNRVNARAKINKNKFVRVDSLLIKSENKISKNYLSNYTGIYVGSPYDESKIKELNNRISEIPFVQMDKKSEVQFFKEETKVILHLSKKKSSNFNGIIGFLPDPNSQKLLVTGDMKLNLLNSLDRGEHINIEWQRTPQANQELDASFAYPFVFDTKIGLKQSINLFRKDTSFTQQKFKSDIQLLLRRGNFITTYYNYENSNLISTTGLSTITTLPNFADVTYKNYGIGISFTNYDYKPNPRRGFEIVMSHGVGNKIIRKNQSISPEVYDSLTLKSLQFSGNGKLAVHIPIASKLTWKIQNQFAYLTNKNLFVNELYRIGGFYSIRGFDEQSILTSSYSIFTSELRFLLDKNSNVFLFWNGGITELNTIGKYNNDFLQGFGVGTSFATNNGVFTINYALGQQNSNPIKLNSSKIHFGFTSTF